MASYKIFVLENDREKLKTSASETFDFLSIKVGASGLEIKETSGNFDFSAKKLVNIAAGTANGEALSYTQRGAANGVASLDSNSLVPVAQIPPAALERLVVVADQTARFALTTATVQNGDTVKQTDTGVLYMVKDEGNLGNAAGYESYSAGTAVNFSGSLSGDVTGTQGATAISAATVTGKLITGFTSGAGTVAATDTILQAIQKLDGNDALKLATASFTDAAVTGKLITGFTSGAGTVAATDTILQAIQKLDGNVSSLGVSGAQTFTNDNAGTISVRQVVYVKANGNVDLARADVANLADFHLGIVKDATIATTASGSIYVAGGEVISGFSGLTPGQRVYVSRATAGALTQSLSGFVAGEFVYSVGRAISATKIVYDPEFLFEF